jgi:hypothetical protein
MTQANLPNWVPILIGGGGVATILTVLLNLYKESKILKDDYINSLKSRIDELRLQHTEEIGKIEKDHQKEVDRLHRELESKKQELAEMGDLRNLHEKFADILSTQEKTPETRKLLNRLENLLADFEQDKEIRRSTKTAAEWLNEKRKTWENKAIESAIRTCPNYFTAENPKNTELFKSDIQKYMDWVYDSLRLSFTCRMENYVEKQSIDSIFPYRAAFQELSKISDFGPLLESEVKDLQDYISELSRRALG